MLHAPRSHATHQQLQMPGGDASLHGNAEGGAARAIRIVEGDVAWLHTCMHRCRPKSGRVPVPSSRSLRDANAAHDRARARSTVVQ